SDVRGRGSPRERAAARAATAIAGGSRGGPRYVRNEDVVGSVPALDVDVRGAVHAAAGGARRGDQGMGAVDRSLRRHSRRDARGGAVPLDWTPARGRGADGEHAAVDPVL